MPIPIHIPYIPVGHGQVSRVKLFDVSLHQGRKGSYMVPQYGPLKGNLLYTVTLVYPVKPILQHTLNKARGQILRVHVSTLRTLVLSAPMQPRT